MVLRDAAAVSPTGTAPISPVPWRVRAINTVFPSPENAASPIAPSLWKATVGALVNGAVHCATRSRRVLDASAVSVVDFHSVVIVDDGSGRWLCDPYFGSSVPIPAPGQPAAEFWRLT